MEDIFELPGRIIEFLELPPFGFFLLTCLVIWFLYSGFSRLEDRAEEILEELKQIKEKLDKDN